MYLIMGEFLILAGTIFRLKNGGHQLVTGVEDDGSLAVVNCSGNIKDLIITEPFIAGTGDTVFIDAIVGNIEPDIAVDTYIVAARKYHETLSEEAIKVIRQRGTRSTRIKFP